MPRRCQGEEYDELCPKNTMNVTDVAVRAVVAREKPLSFAKTLVTIVTIVQEETLVEPVS